MSSNFPMKSRFVWTLGLSLWAVLPVHAQNGFKILDDEAEAGGYDVTAKLNKLPAEFWVAKQEDGSGYRVRVDEKLITLGVQKKTTITSLAQVSEVVPAGANFVLQRRGPRLNIILDNHVALRAEDDSFSQGAVGVRGDIQDARVQPVESIAFDDDFMRVASDVAMAQARSNPRQGVKIRDAQITEDIWTNVQGKWQTTGLTENAEAQVAQSANPFAFKSADKGTNIALSGRPFWSDYTLSSAVKADGAAAMGLLIYAQDEKNYLGLIWPSASGPVLRAMVGGQPRVLAANPEMGGFDNKQWYRLRVNVAGGLVRGFIDDIEVVRARTGLFGRGKVGLYAEAADASSAAIFDDASVRSIPDFYDDFSTPVPGRWTTIAGNWSFNGAAQPIGDKGAYAVLGEPDWSDYTVAADLFVPADGAAGLVLHHEPGKGAYLLRVAGSKVKLPYAGKVQIVKIAGGSTQVLGETVSGAKYDNSTTRWSFTDQRGYLEAGQIDANGLLNRAADAFDESLASGRAGVYAQKGLLKTSAVPAARQLAVEFPNNRPTWAKVPDLYELEQQAQTMGGWSTPQGFWIPASTQGNPNDKLLWHKGAFWGDDTLRFVLPDLSNNGTLKLVFKKSNQDELALNLTATAGLKAQIQDGPKSYDGEAKFDSVKDLPVEIDRRGTYVIVRAGPADSQKLVLAARVG